MTLIQQDNKIKTIKLTKNEIEIIIEELGQQPHSVYEYLNYEKIINKLKDGLNSEDENNKKVSKDKRGWGRSYGRTNYEHKPTEDEDE